jgi:hypothetical protein
MERQLLLTLCICSVGLLTCCGDEKKSPAENNLMYQLISYQKQSEGCDTLHGENCAKIKIMFPQITYLPDNIIKENINKSISTLFFGYEAIDAKVLDFETLMDEFIREYESFIKEFPDAFQFWVIERTGEVKLNKGNIFSIDYLEYSFTGGAHPNTFITFRNFNLADGKVINLDKLISPDRQEELRSIAEDEFRKIKNLGSADDLGQAGFWFEDNKFYLNENFLITDSSLVFYYNNYEITAYAFGPTELEISYSKIKDLIDGKSLLSEFID